MKLNLRKVFFILLFQKQKPKYTEIVFNKQSRFKKVIGG